MSRIDSETLSAKTKNFNELYFMLHDFLMKNGDKVSSRNGATVELLNFKTIITNPIERCIGGYKRDINVFFLLAEALWIFAGRKDVEFLDTFNSRLKDYSDNGRTYHAPYGWRLRHWGVDSDNISSEENKHANFGEDQIRTAIKMLHDNPEDRRVVLSIWNPDLDLNVKSKDLPCNDMIMYKIRNGKLYGTIQNRSNDLNLGLTTNIFQFSFIGEIISKILNIGLGDQVHNSHSLHLYLDHPLTSKLHKNLNEGVTLYEIFYSKYQANQMDFNFTGLISVEEKLSLIDLHINSIISLLSGQEWDKHGEYKESLKQFSRYFYAIFNLLWIYKSYKTVFGFGRVEALHSLKELANELPEIEKIDYYALAVNFFVSRLKPEELVMSDVKYGNF